MPGMTGIELSRKLLKIKPDIPIILCTGLNKATICQEAKKAGIREFVMKPINMKYLADLVRDVLKKNKKAVKNKEEILNGTSCSHSYNR
jgi:FixJ family two-component response regulator